MTASGGVCDGTSAVGESRHRISGASVGQPTEPCLAAIGLVPVRPSFAPRFARRRPHEKGNVSVRNCKAGQIDRSGERCGPQPPPQPSPQIKRIEPQRRPQERMEKPIALGRVKPRPARHHRLRQFNALHPASLKAKFGKRKWKNRNPKYPQSLPSRGPGTLLCAPKDPENDGVHTKRKAACVATSGPSLGRKRPRRAAIAGALPHALAKTIAIRGSIERRWASGI